MASALDLPTHHPVMQLLTRLKLQDECKLRCGRSDEVLIAAMTAILDRVEQLENLSY